MTADSGSLFVLLTQYCCRHRRRHLCIHSDTLYVYQNLLRWVTVVSCCQCQHCWQSVSTLQLSLIICSRSFCSSNVTQYSCWQQTANTSCTLGYKRFKEKASKTTKELDRHHSTSVALPMALYKYVHNYDTTRFEKHRRDLGSSATARCQQKAGVDVWGNVTLMPASCAKGVSSTCYAGVTADHDSWQSCMLLSLLPTPT